MTTREQDYLEELLVEAEHLSRYYGVIADRRQNWHFVLSLSTILMSILAAAFVLVELRVELSASLFVVVSTLTAIMLVYDFSGRAQVARGVSERAREIYIDLKHIKYNECQNAMRLMQELEKRLDASTRVALTVDDKLSEQAYEEAKSFQEASKKD